MPVRKNHLLKKSILSFSILFMLFSGKVFADAFATGNICGQMNFYAKPGEPDFNPELTVDAAYEGQFNFSNNIWGHLAFSIRTEDFIEAGLASSTNAEFTLDELSATFRSTFTDWTNYFGAYIGCFDPVGSDIFMQRYLGSNPIESKITENWLGRRYSEIYYHHGLGFSNIIKINTQPLAIGLYAYFNTENGETSAYLNTDLRIAGVYRYCSFDTAFGFGFPKSGGSGFLAIDKVYFHGGATVLIGNAYTQSLFLQAGLFDATLENGNPPVFNEKDFYFIIEPRFLLDYLHMNLSIYSVPQSSVDKHSYMYGTLGTSLNIYSNSLAIGDTVCTLGCLASAAYTADNTFFTIFSDPSKLVPTIDGVDLVVTPYFSTTLLSGEFSTHADINVLSFFRPGSKWYENFKLSAEFKLLF